MSSDLDGPLRSAANYIASIVRRRSPSARIAGKWRVVGRSNASVHLVVDDLPAFMTQTNNRHPSWGRRGPGQWHHENERNPGRTHWAWDAVDAAIDVAVDKLADEYIRDLKVDL